jgi:hypothetical protein
MRAKFKVGDRVRWNSEAGMVTGRIVRVHTSDVDYKGYTHHASAEEPTDHVAMHKGRVLHRIA